MQKNEHTLNELLNRMQQGADFYNQAPVDDELDLVNATRRVLMEAGCDEEKLRTHYDQSRFVVEASGKHAHAQQFQLNRYFYTQFSIVDVDQGGDIRLQRYQLLYEIKPSEWLTILKDSIAPRFAELGLPGA